MKLRKKLLMTALCAATLTEVSWAQTLDVPLPEAAKNPVQDEALRQLPGMPVNLDSDRSETPKPQAQPMPSRGQAPSPDASGAAQEKMRYVERPGTGASVPVTTAPAVKPQAQKPTTPPTAPLSAVEKSLKQAGAAGGVPMDPRITDVNLPGLKRDDPSVRPWVLYTRNGVNEVVNLSSSFVNRIATPFRNPVIVDAANTPIQTVGSDVYVTPKSGKPVGLYIINGENKQQVISLTIIPIPDIPGQNVIVKLEDLRADTDLAQGGAGQGGIKNPAGPAPSSYVGQIRALLTQAVRGTIRGYAVVPIEGGVAKIGDLSVTPDIVFTGSTLDIYRYKIVNEGQSAVDLVESAFYREGIRAVAFFPNTTLQPKEQTYVFILANKTQNTYGVPTSMTQPMGLDGQGVAP